MEDQVKQHQSWWQKQQKPLIIVTVVVITILALLYIISLLVQNFGWSWIGFNGGYSTITKTPQGTTITIQYPPGKTLWDWLQLLIVPIIIVIGGFWLNQIQKSREEKTEKQRTKLETQMGFMRRVQSAHATIKSARDLLNAHQSPKTYSEQSRQLMQIQTEVDEISLDLGASPHLFSQQKEISNGLDGINAYLNEAIEEYIKHHNDVDAGYKAGLTLIETIKEKNMEWVRDFMDAGKGYQDKYVNNLTKVKGTMRTEIYGGQDQR